jgi:hypothetical protein
MNTNPPPLTPEAVDALVLDTEPWLSCEECFERMDTHVEALLHAGLTDPAMDKHLLGCPACAEEAQSLLHLLTSED